MLNLLNMANFSASSRNDGRHQETQPVNFGRYWGSAAEFALSMGARVSLRCLQNAPIAPMSPPEAGIMGSNPGVSSH